MSSKTQLNNEITEKDKKIKQLQAIINQTNERYKNIIILRENLTKEVFRLRKIIDDLNKPKKWYEFWR